jgi:hypothetical protein
MMPGPNNDASAALVSPTLRNDIASFFNSLHHFALVDHSLRTRFQVTLVGINKAPLSVQHESLAIWVKDTHTEKRHEFVIDRVPSSQLDDENRFSIFSQFPSSQTVIKGIEKALRNKFIITTQIEAEADLETIDSVNAFNG